LLTFTFTKIRKEFGSLCSGLFALSIVAMPHMMFYTIEIRAYSWIILFLTLSFFYGYKSLKNLNYKNFGLLTLFSILTAYTNYFAILCIIVIYFIILLHIILRNRKEAKKWILSVGTSIVLYLPWLYFIFKNNIHVGYLQVEITNNIFSALYIFYSFIYPFLDLRGKLSSDMFPFLSIDPIFIGNVIVMFLLITSVVLLVYFFNVKKKKN